MSFDAGARRLKGEDDDHRYHAEPVLNSQSLLAYGLGTLPSTADFFRAAHAFSQH